jgi:predicted RND superfamily exporter protein
VLVLVLELAVLWWYFRRLAAVAALLATLAVGCAVTFGLTQLLVGYLNANTAFLGGIVLGNGINPTIVLLARYLEERRRGAPVDGALLNAWSATLPATFVASFAAGLAYLSLASTSFRGFSQFGVIGFLGMASCWLSTYLVLPAIVATLDARGRLAPRPNAGRSGVRLARFVTAHQTGLRAATVGVLLFGVMGAVLRRHDAVEYDWTRLRSRHSQREGTNYWGHRSDRVYEGSIPPVTPVVLWAPSPAELEATLAALERRREALGQQDPIRLVQSIHDAVPPDQGRRIALLDEIRPLLSDAILKHLSPEQRRTALQLRPVTDLRPVTLQDLPHPLQQALVERDGTAGRVALLYPRDLLPTDLRKSRAVSAVVSAAITESGGHTLAYSPLLLLAEIGAATLRDGPHATWVALVLVSLLVVVLMRRPRDIAAVLGSLLMGVAALVGIAAATGQRVNFINFVVLPITFGIGVDYAANVVHRFRTDRAGGLEHALGETGGAIALCSATTIIGYGSLWIADNQALAGFGVLAALGELTCLSAALCLLPAWLTRVRKQPP